MKRKIARVTTLVLSTLLAILYEIVRCVRQQIKVHLHAFFIVVAMGTSLKFKLSPRWPSNQSKSWPTSVHCIHIRTVAACNCNFVPVVFSDCVTLRLCRKNQTTGGFPSRLPNAFDSRSRLKGQQFSDWRSSRLKPWL